MKVTGQYFHTYGTVSFSTRLHIILRFLFRIVCHFFKILNSLVLLPYGLSTLLYIVKGILLSTLVTYNRIN